MRTVAATRADVLPSKTCSKCKTPKLITEFYAHPAGRYGRQPNCKSCGKAAYDEWREKNPVRARAMFHSNYLKYKMDAIDAYGGRCTCCGEDRLYFLSIDHVQGDGAEHRRSLRSDGHRGGGVLLYKWLKDEGYPVDGRFQVLCHNCNGAKRTKDECPCRLGYVLPMQGQLALFSD